MTPVVRKVRDESEVDDLLNQALDRAAQRITDRIRQLIMTTAAIENQMRPVGELLTEYYRDEKLPVFSGELLRSMTVVTRTGEGDYEFTIKAPYATQVEEGHAPLTQEDFASNPVLQAWAKARDARGGSGLSGTPHPFVGPRVDEVMEEVEAVIIEEIEKAFS